ncbi:chemotaxis protein CheW [Chelativorans salis]|uniref:Chemotaxis protein CheW n=1 Tax=Chelativorans salis TaxID=2978478 RepID=A0ABT2LL32_9HYPH|nr:chemotaxis protein CheW [Chelativorans sp. EGI FJ00035]MCT7374368.1 chemotaxis protein CheW [Chelativorans sp. EGI FJ00035]
MAARKSSHSPIDWAAARQRLAAAREATEALLNPSPEKRQQILEAHAAALAARNVEAPAGPVTGTVSFTLSDKRYAIETRYVCGVVSLENVTPLPRTPSYVVGVYDLRGQLLPVFDLRIPLGLPTDAASPVGMAIACGEAQPEFLFLTDAVSEVADLTAGALADPEGDEAWVRGLAADGTTLLDGAAILNDRRFFIDDRQDTQAEGRGGRS